MSGVFGITQPEDCLEALKLGAPILQNRGDDCAGFSLQREGTIQAIPPQRSKMVTFLEAELPRVSPAETAIAHTSQRDPQPVTIELTRMGPISVAFDGKIVNRDELQEKSSYLVGEDAGIIARLIASAKDPLLGIRNVFRNVKGPFCLTLLTPEGLFAARDVLGIRPFILGRRVGDGEVGCAVASESAALSHIGMETIRDVRPGEIVHITPTGFTTVEQRESPGLIFCCFEHAYWARPASVIEGIPVGLSRHNAGRKLAPGSPIPDIVAGLPMSGNTAAEGLAQELGVPLRTIFEYNTEAGGRSFLPLSSEVRSTRARNKLLIMIWSVKGLIVIIVDDSIVEGRQTLARMHLVRMAGAKETHLAIETPPMRFSCPFDITTRGELMAATSTEEEMAKRLGVKTLRFNTTPSFVSALIASQTEERKAKDPIEKANICTGCFTGEFPEYE
ncbi:amidophosphoribosyltransferase [Patescibacteria group bacterium]